MPAMTPKEKSELRKLRKQVVLYTRLVALRDDFEAPKLLLESALNRLQKLKDKHPRIR